MLLLNQFYKPDTAATGQLLADVAERLVACGHEVDVICGRHGYNGGSWSPTTVETIEGVRVHHVATTGFGRLRLAGRAVDYLSFFVSATVCAFRLPKADLCVSLTTPPFIAVIGWLLSKLRGTKNVMWVMDLYPEIAVAYHVLSQRSVLRRVLGRLNRRLYANAAAVISLGEVMTRKLYEAGARAERLYTVHNWVPGEAAAEG